MRSDDTPPARHEPLLDSALSPAENHSAESNPFAMPSDLRHPSSTENEAAEKPITRRKKEKRPKKRRSLFWRMVQWLFTMATIGLIIGLMGIAAIFHHYTKDLPSTDQLSNYDPAVVTRLYAGDGKLMAEYAKEKRFFLPLSAIPKTLQHAFISAEDQNFYTHQGVDLWAVARAMKQNLTAIGTGGHMIGGSTITQQVVKNFLLTSERSVERKVKEAVLAWRISQTYSKDKILELYLNEIYLGKGTYGVAAAAMQYFDKSLDRLTIEEAALLASLPKAPAYFDPEKNYKRALERRTYVIGRMLEDGYITQTQAEAANKTPITVHKRGPNEIARADFFAEEVRRNLASMYGSSVLYESGLFVKTTLNTPYQIYADRALRHALMLYDQRHGYRGPIGSLKNEMDRWKEGLERIRAEKEIPLFDTQQLALVEKLDAKQATIRRMDGDQGTIALSDLQWARKYISTTAQGPAIRTPSDVLAVGDVVLTTTLDAKKHHYALSQIPAVNGAMVVMDPHTGKVLALSGGYSYGDSEFNRATQAKRQPGSAFKPFVYMTALENGFSPNSIVEDGPIALSQGPGMPLWRPKNYEGDYMGPTTFRMGLEKSRNLMTVRIAQMIGIKRIKRVAKRLGIYDSDKTPENYSMVLGAHETTVLKLANAYSMLANGGRRVAPWLIERIDDRNGMTIFRRDARVCERCLPADETATDPMAPTLADERERVIDPRVAYQMTSILQGVVQRGTATAALTLNRPIAGKTGTTNESRDTWFVGYTPDLVIATYVGFDTPRPLGARETGGRIPIQAFIKFFEQAGDTIPKTAFRAPPGIREIPVDRKTGQPLFDGQEAGASVISEAFLTGGPIFKPQNELDEELANEGKEISSTPTEELVTPEEETIPENEIQTAPLGTNAAAPAYTPPAAGQMAPYQRPIDPQGFNPDAGAGGIH